MADGMATIDAVADDEGIVEPPQIDRGAARIHLLQFHQTRQRRAKRRRMLHERPGQAHDRVIMSGAEQDLAVLRALKDPSVLGGYKQVGYMPFDPVSKRTEATIEDSSGKQFKVSKGMPPVIFKFASLTGDDLPPAEKAVSDQCRQRLPHARRGAHG